ncbi:hypothetical protein ACF06I_11775 [Streptomyces albidoflavus]
MELRVPLGSRLNPMSVPPVLLAERPRGPLWKNRRSFHVGRFTSQGPSSREKNPHLHAEGDPVNRIDPIGPLSMGDVVGAAAGTVTGVALDGVAGPVLGGAAGGCAGGAATAAVDGEGADGVGKSCLDRGREYGTPVPPGWEVR